MPTPSDFNRPFNTPIKIDAMKKNAEILYQKLTALGWSLNAIAGALGNWQSECTLNPNDPQYISGYPNLNVTASAGKVFGNGGFGFAQWTPVRNKIGWYAQQKGLSFDRTGTNPPSDVDFQLEYHEYECSTGLKGDSSKKTWYSNHGYSYSWEQWKKSTDTPETLASAYYWQYERSGAQSVGNRATQARYWYDYLKGETPIPPTPVPTAKILKGGKNVWRILHLIQPF